ncbi:MAG: SUMF1/EgtB/PvdO family nonheme iron enzyme [Gemmataceae bacterium]|nr:SUMF1/EgtB/PvdO family nonheme iron enzyme [Gemmataceae bacterium]
MFAQLAQGTLSPEDSEVIARHLEQCAACGERFGAWGCDWLRALQASAGRDVAIAPPVEAMMRRLEKWAVETPPLGRVETATTAGGDSQENADPASMLQPARGAGELGWLGTYRVLKVLGQGGMGIVFLAEDSVLKRPVALKVMRGALAERTSARQRFLREAQSAAAVHHGNVVTIYQAGEQAGIGFLAMELLHGESLDARLERENRLPIAMAVDLGRQIARGLAAAHARGLIHRDLKPGNIFLASGEPALTPQVKLLDFGLARAVADDAKLTQSGTVVGTPAYMAPEQAEGKPVDARSDLFSLGCVLYQMVVGARPFRGDSTLQVLRALAVEQPASPRHLNPECPAALSDLITQLLSKDPAGRPVSAAAVAVRLDHIAEAAPRRKRPRAWWLPRWPRAAAMLGLLGVLAVAAVVLRPPELRPPEQGNGTDNEKGVAKGVGANKNDTMPKDQILPQNAEQKQADEAKRLSVPVEITNSIGMKLRFIPAGRFRMGSPKTEPGHKSDEEPQHEVMITKAFYMGAFEVTQEQYQKTMEANPAHFQAAVGGGPDFPVEMVWWKDADAFCRKLSELPAERAAGRVYRLPTEAEWEYACRAGSIEAFHFGPGDPADQALARYDWCARNSGQRTHPVGQLRPNAFGLYDLHGNVMEWCRDWYAEDYYQWSPAADPPGAAEGIVKVARGSSYCHTAGMGRCAARNESLPNQSVNYIGFRVFMVLVPAT